MFNKAAKVKLGLLILLSAFTAKASTPQELSEIRETFLKAEHEARYGTKSSYLSQALKIKDYPLAPYAEAVYLQRKLSLGNKRRIKRLLQQYPDAPFSHRLRKSWLSYLAKRQLRQAFLEEYVDTGDAKLACLNLTWQLQNGAGKYAVLEKVEELWLAPYSQPKECNYIFDVWKKDGNLTSHVALKRIELAAKAKNYRLLPYLNKFVDKSNKHLSKLWKKAVSRPANIAKTSFFKNYDRNELKVFLYAINKLVFVAPEKVEHLWQQVAHRFPVTQEQDITTRKKIAIAFAVSSHEDGLDWLLRVPEEVVDESVKQWRLAYSLKHGEWQDTLNIVNTLPEHMQADESILYWKARALEQLGDTGWSQRAFNELSERRDYYGFLAADKVGLQGNLRHVPLSITDSEFANVGKNEALQRAYELFKLERFTAARKEWNLLSRSLTDREKLAAAKLAHNWGWYDRPIFTLAEVGYLNDVNLRFPLAHKSLLLNSAQKNKLDPAHVFAITRRESSFMHDAYSSAGAAGLMQIKPSTASYMAKRKVKRGQLFKPEQNAKFATNYLAYLIEKSKGNPIVATAAYNAGFAKVKRWLPKENMPADAWIETIPYKETRNYVKAVTAYTEVYQQLLERDSEVFSNLDEVEITPSF